MSTRDRVLVGVAAVVVVALALLSGVHALRLALALVVCLVLPGYGWARRLRLGDRGDAFALTVLLSICATVAVGTTMAVAGRWSTPVGLAVLLAVGALGVVPT